MEENNLVNTPSVEQEKDNSSDVLLAEAEKIVNRILKQYDSLVELSKKHNFADKDVNYMFNELKKYQEATKKAFKASDKDDGFSFKR